MTKPLERLSTPTPAFCAICRRRAGPLGYSKKGQPILWVCRDPDCQEQLHRLYDMSQPDFDLIELDALEQGGCAGGAYLESIGKTDLAKLSENEWISFLERVVDGFGCQMRVRLCAPNVPF
jgi:hypothetical protein